jgi:uncharacterized membrane protein
MNTRDFKYGYASALAWGALCGLRSMSGPVFANHQPRRFARTPLQRQLARPAVAHALQALAVAELIADKLPFVPARVQVPSLIVRATSGAVTALAAPRSRRWRFRRAKFGNQTSRALAGAAAAVASAATAYYVRRAMTRRFHLSSLVAGLVEDAVLLLAASRLRA